MGDGAAQLVDRLELELEVGAQHLLDRLADPQAAEHLEIGQAVEEEDALGEPVGMLHLVDQFVALDSRRAASRPNCRASGSGANIG